MGKHVLFVIHGIGVHDDQWAEAEDGPATTLREISQDYEGFERTPLEERVDIETLTYDDIFQKERAKWSAAGADLRTVAAGCEWISPQAMDSVTGWLEGAGSETEFWWTHAADLVMYRLMPDYRNRVRTKIIEKMGAKIKAVREAEQVARCSVLAHSMGTAVAHDCIHLLVTREWGGAVNALGPDHWSFESLFMVSNLSQLLEERAGEVPPAYQSVVRPRYEGGAASCSVYWNFRHPADYATYPCMFKPSGWGEYYHDVTVNHYRSLHVHGLSHYLRNPLVHAPILRLAGDLVFSKADAAKATDPDAFPQFGDELAPVAKLMDLRDDLERFRSEQPDSPTIGEWISEIVGFYEILRRYA